VRFKPQRESYKSESLTTRPLAPTKAHGCEQHAQSFYLTATRPGSQVRNPTLHYATKLPTLHNKL